MPTTSVAKISGAMMDLIRFKNRFDNGLASKPRGGTNHPIKIPRNSPIKILLVNEIFGIGIESNCTFHASNRVRRSEKTHGPNRQYSRTYQPSNRMCPGNDPGHEKTN
jgi:hypothetical protein